MTDSSSGVFHNNDFLLLYYLASSSSYFSIVIKHLSWSLEVPLHTENHMTQELCVTNKWNVKNVRAWTRFIEYLKGARTQISDKVQRVFEKEGKAAKARRIKNLRVCLQSLRVVLVVLFDSYKLLRFDLKCIILEAGATKNIGRAKRRHWFVRKVLECGNYAFKTTRSRKA